jgi:DNA repair protein RecO
MKQHVTDAIILSRTDYGEADRILTVLTPEYGKLSLLARGVRRIKSKLAGGIELFSVSTITFARGRGELGTLVSTRLKKHYGNIVKDLPRTMLGYDLIKKFHKVTEDEPEPEYFELLQQAFEALDDHTVPLPLVRLWFDAQIIRLGGHTPNLQTDEQGRKLVADQLYDFDFDRMQFVANPLNGRFAANHIKFLRLVYAGNTPQALMQVQGMGALLEACSPLVEHA